MKLSQLQYLLEIYDQGSISKAAQKLFISQPSISAAIKDLENELGYEIMKRNKKGIKFTEAGEFVVEKARNIMSEIDEIKSLKQSTDGTIFVAGIPFICDFILIDTMINLKSSQPNLKIVLDENDAFAIIDQVCKNDIDFGIIMICNNEEAAFSGLISSNNLAFDELLCDEMCFFVGRQNPYYASDEVSLEEILVFPYIVYKNSLNALDRAFFSGNSSHLELDTININDRDSVKKYISKSCATAAMPKFAIYDNIYYKGGLIKPLSVAEKIWSCRIGIIYKKDHSFNAAENIFISNIKNILTNAKNSF